MGGWAGCGAVAGGADVAAAMDETVDAVVVGWKQAAGEAARCGPRYLGGADAPQRGSFG